MFETLKRVYFEKQVDYFREFMRNECINDYIKTFGNIDGMRKPSMSLIDKNKIVASIDINDNGEITLRFSKGVIQGYNHDLSVLYSKSLTTVFSIDENCNFNPIECDIENEDRIFKKYMKLFKMLFDVYYNTDCSTNNESNLNNTTINHNRYNLNNTTINHNSNTVKNNSQEDNIKKSILKMSSEMPYKTIVIKDIKKGTTVGVDTRLNKIDFEKCKNTGKMLLIIKKGVNENIRKIEIYLDDIVKVSDYESKLIIEVYEKENFTNNRDDLNKSTTNHNSNTVKNNFQEDNIKRNILKISSERPYRTIVIKDIKKGTTVGVDARLNKIDFEKCKNTGKMLLIIKKGVNKNIRKIEIYLENIVKLSNHNSKFFIEANEIITFE